MKTIPVPMTTVSLATGEETQSIAQFMLLPPAKHLCQTCGHEHPAHLPHNQQQLHYQYSFYADHGRWPTWRDAMAHCADDVRAQWTAILTEKGIDLDGGAAR